MKHEKRNRSGQAYGLTVLTPILDDEVSALAAHLDTFGPEDASPLARLRGHPLRALGDHRGRRL